MQGFSSSAGVPVVPRAVIQRLGLGAPYSIRAKDIIISRAGGA